MSGFVIAPRRPRRRPSLTPMIDVVFLLLVFFMLAARFGIEGALPLTLGTPGTAVDYSGPPRLVDVRPEALALNGVPTDEGALIAELSRLTEAPNDPILLRPRDGADLQRLIAVLEALRDAGFARLVIVEAP
jgi:biopolymer transport protein ExbD